LNLKAERVMKGKTMIAGNIELDMRNSVEAILRRIVRTAWCNGCNEIVELLTVAEASSVAETNPPTLLLWILKGRIHCLDLRGRLLICASSLQRSEAVTGELEHRPG
jgi:hypothetical protein